MGRATARVSHALQGLAQRKDTGQRPENRENTLVWTHVNVRKAYNSLNHLWRNDLLFVYLKPPKGVLEPHRIKSTTNSLEGGINAQLKLLARTHRGRSGEHQRKMLDWWLYLKPELKCPRFCSV